MKVPATSPMASRLEHDAMGDIPVDAHALWGAQTQRALQHFPMVGEGMPMAVIRALALIKGTAARVNASLGMLDAPQADAIARAADEVLAGDHPRAFPLSLWQSGSGTQTHMNMNEVLANRASELLGGVRGALESILPPLVFIVVFFQPLYSIWFAPSMTSSMSSQPKAMCMKRKWSGAMGRSEFTQNML